MATTHKFRKIEVNMTNGSDYPTVREGYEAASSVFKVGDLLVLASGLVALAGADPAAIVGVAEQAASGVTAAPVKVALNVPWVVWEGNLLGAAAAQNITIAQADLWASYGLARDATTTQWYIDKSDTTALRVKIIGLAPGVELGDTNARVLFVFLNTTQVTANALYA